MQPKMIVFVIAMVVVITSSNVLVQFAINDWLTWAAFTYPISFLVTDLTNRQFGAPAARRVVYVGFAVAVVLSVVLASPRIAAASGAAFLCAQLVDVGIFDRLRNRVWWLPPLVSSLLASALDTTVFFAAAFGGTDIPWVTLAIGDFAVKTAMALALLLPFRGLLRWTAPTPRPTGSTSL